MFIDVKKFKYKCLYLKCREDGVIVVGYWIGKWVYLSYDKREVIFIFCEYCFFKFYVEYIY